MISLLGVLSTYPSDNQSNSHKLELEGRIQGANRLFKTTKSWNNWLDSINKIYTNTKLLTNNYIGGR